MPSKEFNGWYVGISKDDYIASENQYIEGNNVTGVRDGYGITLGPKVQKQLETTQPMNGVLFRSGTNLSVNYPYGDNGEIYRLTGADLTPEFTLLNGLDIVNAERGPSNYFFVTNGGTDSVAQIAIGFADGGDFAGNINESFITGLTINRTPAMLRQSSLVHIGTDRNIRSIDNSLTITSFGFPTANVIGLTLSGSTVKVYNDNGDVQFWDGTAIVVNATVNLGFRIRRVVAQGTTDFITSEDGNLYIMSGYSSQKLIESMQSRRLEDNSQYIKKVDFVTGDFDNQTLESAKGDIYLISGDTKKGIYQYGHIIEGLPNGFNKIITRDNLGVEFTNIQSLKYFDQPQKLFICHTSPSGNFVDFVGLDDLTTAKDGFVVTNIFRGPPNKINKMKEVRITTSHTDGTNNFIKLYKRVDGGTWELIRTINNSTSTIKRLKINTKLTSSEFVDIQFKAELHNDLQDDTPPILHSLELIYSINKN